MTSATARGRGLANLEPPPGGPVWLDELRQEAAGWVHDHGLPTARDEDWKYTPLEALADVPYRAAPTATTGVSLGAVDALTADLGGPRLVFVNGSFIPGASRRCQLPAGVTVTDLAGVLARGDGRLRRFLAPPDGRWRHTFAALAPPDGRWRHAFAALNTALFADGAFIDVPPDAVIDQPIHLVFISQPGFTQLLASPRTIVRAGARSRVTIVEHYTGMPEAACCTNAVTEVEVGEEARVEHYSIQDEPVTVSHLGSLNVRQDRASRFSSQSVTLGGSLARNEVTVRLEGEASQADLGGLYLPGGHQTHVNTVLVEHVAPGGTSRQLYKGVMDGHGHGVFNGRVVVHPGAAGTDASQTNRNLLLSDQAEADTRPRLEIFADDVKCAHGAAVGQLDPDALFYLRSRGIPGPAARTMLIAAFAGDIVARLGPAPLRSWVEHRVTDRLRAGNDTATPAGTAGGIRIPPPDRGGNP